MNTLTSADNPGVVVFPPALFGGSLLLGLGLGWLFPIALPLPRVMRPLGIVLAVVAGLFAKWGERELHRAGTNIRPSQPTTAIVTTGPYRFTRNPLYLALTAIYVGITLAFATAWPLVLLVPVLIVAHFGIIKREERYLAAKFGQPYLEYQRRVRRWL